MSYTKLREERQVDLKRYNAQELSLLMAEVAKELQFRVNKSGKALSKADKTRDEIYHTIESTSPTPTEQAQTYKKLQKALRYRRAIKDDIQTLSIFTGSAIDLNKVGNAFDRIIPKIESTGGNLGDWYEDGKVPQYTRVYKELYQGEEN